MDLPQLQGHRHLDDVTSKYEKIYEKYGKPKGKSKSKKKKTVMPSSTPQPLFTSTPAPKRRIALQTLQPTPTGVLNTGELPSTVTIRRKGKRAPVKKDDKKKRMKKRHWYEDKFGDVKKFVKKPKKPRKKRKFKKGTKGFKPLDKRTTLLSLIRKIPAASVPLVRLLKVESIDGRGTLLSLMKKIPQAKLKLSRLMSKTDLCNMIKP